jgi:DNA-binding beta-propeller fold protein YncE
MKNFGSASMRIVLSLLLLGSVAAAADAGYKVINTFKLGGDGGWDYLTIDSSSRRMYISRATHVMVVDVDSGKIVGDIPDTPGVHGIALAPDLGKGFISNGREGTVTIFDLSTMKVITKVKAGENPDAILYDPASKRVFAFNGRSSDATAIDAAKATVVGTIKLEGKPEFAATDGKGEIFVNIEDKSQIDAIDPNKLEVKSRWPLAPCEEPSGLAIDTKNRRLFAGCDNKMMAVVNADTGKVVTTVTIGEGVDANGFDPDNGLAYASTGDGHMTIAKQESADKYTVVANVETQDGARTMALDAKTHNAYTVTGKFGPAPAPTADNPHPRRTILPDSFVVIVVGK